MSIREQDIGEQLAAAAAARVSEPRFTVESVMRRIRQRRPPRRDSRHVNGRGRAGSSG